MAKGYDEMAEEDKAFSDVTFEAQREKTILGIIC